MPRARKLLTACLATLAGSVLTLAAPRWTDREGNTFHGEPAEVLGPLALFRTGSTGGSKIAWHYLSPEDCVRFYEGIKDMPDRAKDWAQAQGVISRELVGKIKRVQGDTLVDATVAGRPEPEFFILFYADNSEGKSWDMLGRSIEPYNKLQTAFPGMVEGLFFGAHHSATDHTSMATRMKLPWLVADYHEQFRHLPNILQFAPVNDGDFSMMVVNRDGVPLFSAQSPAEADVTKMFKELSELLELMKPENPHGWPDRLYYLRAVQPAAYAHGHSDPVLVGNPLVAEGLRQRKIFQVDAQIAVAADGHVTDATVKAGPDVPATMVAALADALKKAAVFVGAVTNGKFVDGKYAYHLQVPH